MLRSLKLALALTLLASPSAAQVASGQVSTSNPSYSSGQPAPMSLDPNGGLRTNCITGCSGGGGAVTLTQTVVAPTDKGGTLTLGGTAQNAAASNASRKGFLIQNPCTAAGENIGATEDLYVAVSGAATVAGAGNYADLAPCGSATLILATGTVIQTAVSVNAATTSHRWTATEVQ